MRIGFIGSRSLGRRTLEELLDAELDVTHAWVDNNIVGKLLGTEIIRRVSPPSAEHLGEYTLDLGVCAHNHHYLTPEFLAKFTIGVISYHPSLLPRHRGIDSVRWTVHMRDPIAGGTVHWVDEGLDTGPIHSQRFCHVPPNWSASDLWRERLFDYGWEMLVDAALSIRRGNILGMPQDERCATYEPALESRPKSVV